MTSGVTALRLVRLARDMRVIDSAQLLGLKENRLCRMELGVIPISDDEISTLASIYDVSPAVLKGTEPLVLSTRRPLLKDSPL